MTTLSDAHFAIMVAAAFTIPYAVAAFMIFRHGAGVLAASSVGAAVGVAILVFPRIMGFN